MLSVIVVTNRVGGTDALFAGLAAQTHRGFETLVIDDLCLRSTTMRRGGYHLPHVGRGTYHARAKAWPRWGNYMASLNHALANASGDRLVFWSDYTCPHPETLATHTRFHEEHPDEVMLGGIEYCETPQLHPDFPLRYGWLAMGHDVANHRDDTYAPWLDDRRRHELYEEWRIAYERDLDSGLLDPFMWSTFAKPITSWDDVKDLRVFNHDKRDTSPFLNLKNDSIPRSLLEKIGGFDERADGTHGHQDSITWRQLAKVGAKLRVRAENPVRLLDPHGLVLCRRFDAGKDDTTNARLAAEAQ